jgi:FkbM family methyltransferase
MLMDCALKLMPQRGGFRVVSLLRRWFYPVYRRRMRDGFVMELDLFEWAQLELAREGHTEPLTMALLHDLLRPGDTFVDVGAHVGFVSLVARTLVGDRGRVVAVEPQPYNCERMLRNWELNQYSNLNLHVAAAGSHMGVVKLPQQAASDKSKLSLALPMSDALALEYEVPIVTLHHLIQRLDTECVRTLKIDVEGFELDVLQGLGESVACVQNIVLEVLNPETVGGDHALLRWLQGQGYQLRTMTGDAWNGSARLPENNLWASR